MSKLSNLLPEIDILNQMSIVRTYCSMGHNLRKKNNLPVSLRITEVQFNGCPSKQHPKHNFLWREFYEMIADELNAENINPFFCFDGGIWDVAENGNYKIAIRTDVSEHNQKYYDKNKEYRKKMAEEKKNGTYDEFTYKKYK